MGIVYRRFRRTCVLLFALTVFGGGGLAWYVYVHYTDPETVRRLAIEAAEKALPGSRVRIESASFCLLGGVRLNKIEVMLPIAEDELQRVVECDRLHLYPNRDQLLRGSLEFTKVVLDAPILRLHRDAEGQWNVSRWIKDKPLVLPYGVQVLIRNARVEADDATGALPAQMLTEINARIRFLPKATVRWELVANHALLQQLQSAGVADLDRDAIHLEAESATTLGPPLISMIEKFSVPIDKQVVRQVGGSLKLRFAADITKTAEGFSWDSKLLGELDDGTFVTSKLPHPVRDIEATFELSSKGADLKRLRFTMGTAWGELAGRLPDWDLEQFHGTASLWGLPINQEIYPLLPERHQRTWERFSPSGKADVHIILRRANEQWVTTGTTDVSNVSVRFNKFPYPVTDGRGKIVLHEDGHISIEGAGLAAGREVAVTGTIANTQPKAPLDVKVTAKRVPIDEKLRAAFCATPIPVQEAVAKFDVEGFCDVDAAFTRQPGEDLIRFLVRADVICSRCRSDYFPYPLRNVAGTILVSNYKTEFVSFTGVGLDNSATVELGGQVLKTTDGTQLEVAVDAKDVPLDDTLLAALAPAWKPAWHAVKPEGHVDIECLIVKQAERPLDVTVFLDPKPTAAVTPTAFPYRLHDLRGMIRIADGKVAWMGKGNESRMLARHDDVVISCGGSFEVVEGWRVLKLQHLTCIRLPVDGDLRRALPGSLQQVVDFVAPDRPIEMEMRRLDVTWPEDHSTGPTVSMDGQFRFRSAGVVPSVGLKNVTGVVALTGTCSDDYRRIIGQVDLDSMEVHGFRAANVTSPLVIQQDQDDETQAVRHRVDLPEIRGEFYSGRITGKLRSIVGESPAFEFHLNVANASLSEYVRQSYRGGPAIDGVVDAGLLLTGSGPTIGTLNGAGSIRIRQADIIRFPLVYDIVRLLALEVPSDRVFDDVVCDFTLRDKLMLISRLDLTGPSLSLISDPDGRMNLETNAIAVTMKTRWAKDRLKLFPITDILNTGNDQLYLVLIRGQLQRPSINVELLPGVKRILERLDRMGR